MGIAQDSFIWRIPLLVLGKKSQHESEVSPRFIPPHKLDPKWSVFLSPRDDNVDDLAEYLNVRNLRDPRRLNPVHSECSFDGESGDFCYFRHFWLYTESRNEAIWSFQCFSFLQMLYSAASRHDHKSDNK